MKHAVTRFKSMEVALEQLAPFIRDGAHLQSGDPFEKLGGMRSREAVANWVICAALNNAGQRNLTFTSDPIDGDGILLDLNTEETFQTEHVMVPRHKGGEDADGHKLILEAIEHKRAKGGAAYARGKILVVFVDAPTAPWFPNRVAKALPDPLLFQGAWVVSLQEVQDGDYVYGVTALDVTGGDAPAFIVRISKKFDSWEVTQIQ